MIGWAFVGDHTLVDQIFLGLSGLLLASVSVPGALLGHRQQSLNLTGKLSAEITKLESEPEPLNDLVKQSRDVQLAAARKCRDEAIQLMVSKQFSQAHATAAEGLRHIEDFRNMRNMKASKN